jgi:hypothetical protein
MRPGIGPTEKALALGYVAPGFVYYKIALSRGAEVLVQLLRTGPPGHVSGPPTGHHRYCKIGEQKALMDAIRSPFPASTQCGVSIKRAQTISSNPALCKVARSFLFTCWAKGLLNPAPSGYAARMR